MGKVIPFSECDLYLDEIEKSNGFKGVILDTNILIDLSYDLRNDYEDVLNIIEQLETRFFRFFATVNTKAEFLDFQRRLILTESLLDSIDQLSTFLIPKKVKAKIISIYGTIKSQTMTDPNKDMIFSDYHLKRIKKEFSANSDSVQKGWLEFCSKLLKNKLFKEDLELTKRGVEYISPHNDNHKGLFLNEVSWENAIDLCVKSGLSISDSMILNTFQSSKCPFIVSRDFDMGYAVLADKLMKDVIMPDKTYKELKNYQF